MIISITAHRDISPNDINIIRLTMKKLIDGASVTAIYFGGARGGDTEALKAALNYQYYGKKPKLIVVVPDKIMSQPAEAIPWIKKADEVIELGNAITRSDGYASYTNRDHYLVDVCDKLIAFCRGSLNTGGTLKTMMMAARDLKPVEEVILEAV